MGAGSDGRCHCASILNRRSARHRTVALETQALAPSVTLPSFDADDSVNQTLPSGPGAMPTGPNAGVGVVNSVRTPAGVTRATRFRSIAGSLPGSANQRFPSGPVAIRAEPAEGV